MQFLCQRHKQMPRSTCTVRHLLFRTGLYGLMNQHLQLSSSASYSLMSTPSKKTVEGLFDQQQVRVLELFPIANAASCQCLFGIGEENILLTTTGELTEMAE